MTIDNKEQLSPRTKANWILIIVIVLLVYGVGYLVFSIFGDNTNTTQSDSNQESEEQNDSPVETPTETPKPSLTPSEEEANDSLDSYLEHINANGYNLYVSEVGFGDNYYSVKIVIKNLWHYEPKSKKQEVGDLLWQSWAIYCLNEEADACRVQFIDQAGNDLGGSSWLAGSIINVND